MAFSKIDTNGLALDSVDNTILDVAGDYTFTGTVTGAGESNVPLFHIEKASSMSIATDTLTKLTFDTETYDADNVWNTSTNKLTLPSGKFLINFYCTHYGSSYSQGANIYIYKNGSQHGMPFSDFHRNSELLNSHHSSLWGANIVESDGNDEFEIYGYFRTDTGSNTVTYLKIQGFKI